jgi:hypothetical protein
VFGPTFKRWFFKINQVNMKHDTFDAMYKIKEIVDSLKAQRSTQLHLMYVEMKLEEPLIKIALDLDCDRAFLDEVLAIVPKITTPTWRGFVANVKKAMCLDNLDAIQLPFQCKIDGSSSGR